MSEFDDKVIGMIGEAVNEAIIKNLTSYSSPLCKLVGGAVERNEGKIRAVADKAVDELTDGDAFKDSMIEAIRSTLARALIKQFGGQLEKQVNELKANPATRARMTLAVESLMADVVVKKQGESKC